MKNSTIAKTIIALAALLFAGLGDSPAQLFTGKTVGYQYLFPTVSSIYESSSSSFVVGAGVERTGLWSSTDYAIVEISASGILVDFYGGSGWTAASFNGFRIYDINSTVTDFTVVTIDPTTNMAGFGVSNVTFDANNIWVNWQGLNFTPDTIVSLSVNTIPEPSTTLLITIGMTGMGLLRRRVRAKSSSL